MKIMRLIAFQVLIMISAVSCVSGKVLIFTYAFNRPDFIEIQYNTFQKFLLDEYEFVVFNDSLDPDMCKEITDTCKKLNIRCIAIPQEIHARPYLDYSRKTTTAAAVRNCNVVQYSLDEFGLHHDDIVALFDSDLFLIKEFSIREYLDGAGLAAYHRPCSDVPKRFHDCQRDHPGLPVVEYLWIGLVFIDVPNLPNKFSLSFNRGHIIANTKLTFTDSGGYTNYYIQNNKDVVAHKIVKECIERLICKQSESDGSLNCYHNTEELKKITQNPHVIKFVRYAARFTRYV